MNRNQKWLNQLLETTWNQHFNDIERRDVIKIMFGKKAKTRLGSISKDRSKKQVVIRLTALFMEPNVPEMVIKATLVHELCHYAHGFQSTHEQRFKHPHSGGVIKAEFTERGLRDLYVAQKRWLKNNWPQIVKKYYPQSTIAKRERRRTGFHLRLMRYR